jgi:hypothetical protein
MSIGVCGGFVAVLSANLDEQVVIRPSLLQQSARIDLTPFNRLDEVLDGLSESQV